MGARPTRAGAAAGPRPAHPATSSPALARLAASSRRNAVACVLASCLLASPALGQIVSVVEYRHADFGHYFITANADEISRLDAGAFKSWERTGHEFSAYQLGANGASPTCRFFSTAFDPKSSHFYTSNAAECAALKNNPKWQFEAEVFGLVAPDATGTCPIGTESLFRLYNNGQGGAPNHRYTTLVAERASMIARNWIAEGHGVAGVIGCVPFPAARTSPNLDVPVSVSRSAIVDFSAYGTPDKSNYYPRSGRIADLDGDGRNEFVFSVTAYPQVPVPLTVVGDQSGTLNLTSKYFPGGAPAVLHSPSTHFEDIDGDGDKDLVAAEAGLDVPPWTGSKIAVARRDGGTFTNISHLVPETTTRSYAVAVGDFTNSSNAQILLPAQDNGTQGASVLLQYENGSFLSLPNPVRAWVASELKSQSSMAVADFDGDGRDDLLVGGNWLGRSNAVVYGGSTGLDEATLTALPPGPHGQEGYAWLRDRRPWPPTQILAGSDVASLAFDFDKDGRPDVFSVGERVTYYPPGTISDTSSFNYEALLSAGGSDYRDSAFWTYTNVDGRYFVRSVPPYSNLGDRYYFAIQPHDVDRDGSMDVIGHYWTKLRRGANREVYGTIWGTTFFFNDGHGRFSPVEARDVFPALAVNSREAGQTYDERTQIGMIVPLRHDAIEFEGLRILPWWDGAQRAPQYVISVQKFTSKSLGAAASADGR